VPEVLFRLAYISYMEKCLEDGGAQKSFEAQMLSYNKLFGKGSFDPSTGGRKVFNVDWNLKVHEITSELIADLVSSRLKDGLKRASINMELRYHRAVYKYGVRNLGAIANPLFIDWRITKNKPRLRFVTWEEERQILTYLRNKAEGALNYGKGNRAYRLAADLFTFNVEHGCRIGETLLLPRMAFDFDEGTFEVYRPKVDNGDSEHAYATLVLTDLTREVAMRRAKECHMPSDLMFANASRAVRLLRKAIDKVCNTDPIQIARKGKATIHSLRDTFASRIITGDGMGKSLHLAKVGHLLGHASLQTTRKYAHLASRGTSEEAKDTLMAARARAERRSNR
jgi:integrase